VTHAQRIAHILSAFRIEQHSGGIRALWTRPDGSVFAAITGTDRSDVIRRARALWGHFNYDDEAEAFATIFPRREVV
jgi:hypothetical protein